MTNKLFRLPLMVSAMFVSLSVLAASAADIDQNVNETIAVFKKEINGADVFLNQAAGYLVFPRVIKVGAGVGAETGEGALRVGGTTVDYYRTTSGSACSSGRRRSRSSSRS